MREPGSTLLEPEQTATAVLLAAKLVCERLRASYSLLIPRTGARVSAASGATSVRGSGVRWLSARLSPGGGDLSLA